MARVSDSHADTCHVNVKWQLWVVDKILKRNTIILVLQDWYKTTCTQQHVALCQTKPAWYMKPFGTVYQRTNLLSIVELLPSLLPVLCWWWCRENEDAFVQQRDERKPGGEWERVCRLCDFNPKSSRNSKDITRMRSILLQLKQAPAATTAERWIIVWTSLSEHWLFYNC